MNSIDYETELKIIELVEEELQSLHGPRLQRFCRRFARFVKLDYALRFFYLLMQSSLNDEGLPNDELREKDPRQYEELEQMALRNMVIRTCAILDRIVEEYGHLVDQDPDTGPRLGVDMSKLMNPPMTGEAICNSLKKTPAAALRWIIDEIGVWLYGD